MNLKYIGIGFIGFALFLSLKDLMFRFALLDQMTVGLLLLISGFSSLIFGIIIAVIQNGQFMPKRPRYQAIRFLFNGVFWFSVLKGLQLLNATSVALVSKAYIPLFILFGPLFKTNYSIFQRILGLFCLLSMIVFAVLNRSIDESLWGYFYVLLAVLAVMGEYVMLRQSTKDEGLFTLASTPALACILFGTLMIIEEREIGTISRSSLVAAFLAGISVYGAYWASIARYKILPLGLAEYPAILTALVILPVEYFYIGFVPSVLYVLNIFFSTAILGWILYLKKA